VNERPIASDVFDGYAPLDPARTPVPSRSASIRQGPDPSRSVSARTGPDPRRSTSSQPNLAQWS
jgi:hypothetical protein